MNKIKKFYKEHRIFTILMAVVIVCLVLIITILVQCFYVGNSDKYGNRLENIEKYKVEDSRIDEFKQKYSDEKIVSSVDIELTGRIFYIKMVFESDVDLVEAQSIALKSLEEFSEDEKSYYDFNFTLAQEKTDTSDGFLISGAKNKNGTNLIWNNNREVVEEEKEEVEE